MASAIFLLFSHGVSAVEQCAMAGEQPLEFRFFTDNNSWKDNGWVLQCEYENNHNEIVWEVPIGSLQYQDRTEVIREAACIPDTATCYLDIFDGKGDGLEGSKNGNSNVNSFAGWFAFMHGATTIATYKELEDPKFSELTYCVGPKCDKKPQEIQADDEDCQEMVYLAMQLDSKPQDISYQLICGGGGDGIFDKTVVWDGKGFTKAGEYIEEETCLPKDACCEFIVVDSQSNGLTDVVDTGSIDGPGKAMGFIYLETNYAPVLQYDGNTGETFGVLTKQFGCDEKIDRAGEDGGDKGKKKQMDREKIVASEAVDAPEDMEDVVSTEIIKSEDESVSNDSGSTVASQDNEEQELGDIDEATQNEEMLIEVGHNVPGVAEDILPDTSNWLHNYFGNNQFGTSEPSFETSWIDSGSWTVPPTSVNWVSDDDYQNLNDDGRWFGQFYPDIVNSGSMDDIFSTSTTVPTSTSTERDYWALYDDVVYDDDFANWVEVDDELLPPLGMEEIDSMIQNLDGNSLPWDSNAVDFLNGQPVYTDRKVGLTKKHEMVITLLTLTFILWSIGLALYYFWERLIERLTALNGGSNESDDSEGSVGKDDSVSHGGIV